MDPRKRNGDQAAAWFGLGQVLLPLHLGAPAARFGGERLYRHGKELPDGDQADDSDKAPEQAVVEKDARPWVEQRIFFDHRPITGNGVVVKKSDGVEDARPEVFERPRRREGVDAYDVKHEERGALQIDNEYLAGKRGDEKEQRAEKKDLDDSDREERLHVPEKVVGGNAGVVSPWSERAEVTAEDHPGKRENCCDEGASPASAQVGELIDRLGKQYLHSIALEVAKNRGAEDRGDNYHPEEAGADVVVRVSPRPVEKDFAVGVAYGAEALAGDA